MEIPRETLIERAKTLKVMPTLQAVIGKLFPLLDNKDASFHDIDAVIRYEQALTAKLISIANSAYYSRGVEIFTLQRAMTAIGLEEVKHIVVCILFMESILKELKVRPEILLGLWKHSVEVACAAKLLADRTLAEDPAKVFTGALLHDVGKIILYLTDDGYDALVRNAHSTGMSLTQAEQASFGTDHEELGYILSVEWRFPEEFSRVIRTHHEGGTAEPLIALVRVADRFAGASSYDGDPATFLLLKERETIAREMDKILTVFHLNGHGTH